MEFPKRGCLAVFLLTAIAAITLGLFFGCGKRASGPLQALNPADSSQPPLAGAPPHSGPLPMVFDLDACITVTRGVSEDETVTSPGYEAFLNGQTGTNGTSGLNIEQDDTSLILRAFAPGEYAYAVFGQAVGANLHPVSTLIDSDVCDYGGGRDDDIPLCYYIGVADFTIGAWRWFGPFGQEDTQVIVNGEDLQSRFKSPGDNFYMCVLASNGSKATSSSPAEGSVAGFPLAQCARQVKQELEDPGGLRIEQIVTTIREGLTTLPSIVTGLGAAANTSGVLLGWDATTDTSVDLYKVFRDDLDISDAPTLLQDVPVPTVAYVDTSGIPGKNYRYILQAHNNTGLGGSSLANACRLVVPPTAIASDDLTDRITVSWAASEGAVGYLVLRADDITGMPVSVGQTDATTLSYDDTEPTLGVVKWYWVQALGEDLDSALGTPDSGVRIDPWHKLAVDSVGDVGWDTSLAVVNGYPAISYYDSSNGDLKYVRAADASGSTWGSPLTLDSTGDVGRYTSLAVVNSYAAISYYDNTNYDLKYVRATNADGSAWGTPLTLDSTGTVGEYTSLAVVNGYPAISYYDSSNGDLKYVRANDADGSSWGIPLTIDSAGNVGWDTSLEVVNGYPAISYYDQTDGDLMYAQAVDADGSSWGAPVIVDSTGDLGLSTFLAVVSGNPAISYFDYTNADLKYGRASDADGSSWGTPLTVHSHSSGGTVGWSPSLAVVNGLPAISYYDPTDGDDYLLYVQATDANGDFWGAPAIVDTDGDVGQYTSLAEVNTNPAISYYDATNGDLKYAYYFQLRITGITTDNTTLTIGSTEQAQLSVSANDPAATVTWSASTGSFDDTSSKTPVYSPPAADSPQKVTLYVDATDGIDAVQGSIDVVITDLPNLGVTLDFTHPSWAGAGTTFFSYVDDRKVILLNFGATWDGFSMAGLPSENTLFSTYKNDAYYWILDWENTVSAMQSLFTSNGYDCTDCFEDTTLATCQAYSDTFGTGMNAIPEHALIDRDGDVRKFAYGSISGDPAWEDAIKELLGIL